MPRSRLGGKQIAMNRGAFLTPDDYACAPSRDAEGPRKTLIEAVCRQNNKIRMPMERSVEDCPFRVAYFQELAKKRQAAQL